MTAQFIRDMPMADYHAIKALSASGIHTLVEQCPARFFHDSPWNDAREPEQANHFDIGTALHLAVLEPAILADRVVVVPHEDYRIKNAREVRDDAYAAGKTPLRSQDWELVARMSRAIEARPDIAGLFRGGDAEVSLTWDWAGVPCKARPDYLSGNRRVIVDLKSAESAHPDAVARKAFNEGWHLRAPWYMEAVAAATGARAEYLFVVVEKDKPHLIQAYALENRAIAWGQQIIVKGLRRFRDCMRKGEWPSYGDDLQMLSLPTWAEYHLADREAREPVDAEQAETAARMFAP